jgi:crotonobetainyl-CoA:carnitine CoA-transferase CaiB-like acyl-CoA transferase
MNDSFEDAPVQRAGPLDGIRVLDISTVYAAPITAMLLGDFGADVIKVEHPRGDPARSHGANKNGHGLWWKVISRNKRCVTLNLGTPEGQEILRNLALDADVLVENFRPGVLERWGLGPEQLHAVNPGLIMLRVTGFGQTGPYSLRRAFGTLAEAMSGFAHQTGDEDGPPTLPPFGLADGVTGIAGAFAVMTALYHRATADARMRPSHRPVTARAAPRHPWTGSDRLRPTPRHSRPAGQPFAEQRSAQYIPHQRRALGCHLR